MAKANKKQQLNPQQRKAVELIARGRTVSETAAEVNVSRTTVRRWETENPYFITALNRQRLERWDGAQERLRDIEAQAVETLEKALADGDVRVAMYLVRYRADSRPGGATTVEEWIDDQARMAGQRSLFEGIGLEDSRDEDVYQALHEEWL